MDRFQVSELRQGEQIGQIVKNNSIKMTPPMVGTLKHKEERRLYSRTISLILFYANVRYTSVFQLLSACEFKKPFESFLVGELV